MFKQPYLDLLNHDSIKKITSGGSLGKHYIVKYASWGFFSKDGLQPLTHEGKGIYRALVNDTFLCWGDKDAYIKLQKDERVQLFEDGSFKLLKKKNR